MRLTDYLAKRSSSHTLAKIEAQIFGVPYPLQAGWVERCGWFEASTVDLAQMRDQLAMAGDGASWKALRGIQSVIGKGEQWRSSKKTKMGKKDKVKRPAVIEVEIEVVSLERSGYVNSPAFLASYEWRRLRMAVLCHHGSRCMCCGATPAGGAVMHVDHIKPRRRFPALALAFDNLQVLCEDCNHGKGNNVVDFRTVTT